MNMLVDTLAKAGDHPSVWVAIGLIVAHGVFALVQWRTCPYCCGKAKITREEAEERMRSPFLAGPRFLVTMLAGIALVLSGLWLIDADIEPVYAFLLVIAGVFVIQIEPARLRLSESVARVVASETSGPEAMIIARKRLSDSHLWYVALNFVLAAGMTAGILAF